MKIFLRFFTYDLRHIIRKERTMQSDGNSFFGDVVLDRFNMVYSDEDSI